ncbi:MAG: histidine kinase [Bacteroidales bacterium]|nr:histidine kinase [Bacteroidales bacterium]
MINFQVLNRSLPARVIQHFVFWILSYYILIHVFASSSEIQSTDQIYTMVFLFTIAIGVYVNLFLLIPVFLNKGRYISYGLLLASCVLASAYLNQLTFTLIIDLILPGYYFISYFSFIDILKIMVAFIGITSLIKLSKGYFLLLEARAQLLQMQKEKSEAELQALRAQVNPHFLFNSLNSIYAMVLKRSDKASETILKLSDILRYILYETSNEYVKLATELEHMQAYIGLQKIRSGPNAKIEVTINGEPHSRKIAPLLFLPLIENSFKHGVKGETGPSFIIMKWEIEDRLIRFVVENNKGQAEEAHDDRHNGIGIINLKKRLDMAYPGKHHFEISETEDRFKAELLIWSENES